MDNSTLNISGQSGMCTLVWPVITTESKPLCKHQERLITQPGLRTHVTNDDVSSSVKINIIRVTNNSQVLDLLHKGLKRILFSFILTTQIDHLLQFHCTMLFYNIQLIWKWITMKLVPTLLLYHLSKYWIW